MSMMVSEMRELRKDLEGRVARAAESAVQEFQDKTDLRVEGVYVHLVRYGAADSLAMKLSASAQLEVKL